SRRRWSSPRSAGASDSAWPSCSRCAGIPPVACCRSSTGPSARSPSGWDWRWLWACWPASCPLSRPAGSGSSTRSDGSDVAIPLVYNVRSLRARWSSTVVAVLGIAGTVGVFVAMLSLARGFEATLVASGSARNAIVRRAGATSEMDSSVMLEQVRVIEEAPGVERGGGTGPLVSPEVVVIASFPLKGRGTEGNAQVRGVSLKALTVRPTVKIVAGRAFQPGLSELLVGRNVASSYDGLELGKTVRFGGGTWTVVGVFDSGGNAYDSELWCDFSVLRQVYQRPQNMFQSATARLASPDALTTFKDALTADPRVTVQIDREIDYYAKQSRQLTTLITVLGTIVAVVMGIGAVFGALNTMYSAVAERAREIATLRALGFGSGSIVISFVVES